MDEAQKPPAPKDAYEQLVQGIKDRDSIPAEYRDEYDAFLKQKHAEMVAKYDTGIEPDQRPLNKLGRGLMGAVDYVAGNVRVPAGYVASQLTGRPDVVPWEEVKNAAALNGRPAMSTSEILHRAGVPEGPHLSDAFPDAIQPYAEPGTEHAWYRPEKKGFFDPTARGAVAFASDAFLSPPGLGKLLPAAKTEAQLFQGLTAKEIVAKLKDQAMQQESKGLLRKIGEKLVKTGANPLGSVAKDDIGTPLYKSAFHAEDAAAGGNAAWKLPSDVGLEEGIHGSPATLAKKMGDVAGRKTDEVIDILAKGDANPNAVVYQKQALSRALQLFEEKRGTMGLTIPADAVAKQLAQELKPFEATPTFGLLRSHDIKKVFQDLALAHKAYEGSPLKGGSGINSGVNQIQSKLKGETYSDIAQGYRRGIEDAADATSPVGAPGQGGQVFLKNRDIGAVAGARGSLEKRATQSPWQSLHQGGPAAAAAGAVGAGIPTLLGSPDLALPLAAIGALGTSTAGRTGLGLLLHRYGAGIGNLTRAGLVERYSEGLRNSPWQLMDTDLHNLKKGQ